MGLSVQIDNVSNQKRRNMPGFGYEEVWPVRFPDAASVAGNVGTSQAEWSGAQFI